MQQGLKIFPIKRDIKKSLELCQNLGGTLAVADDSNIAAKMIQMVKEYGENETFNGYSDMIEEGKWINVNTGKEMEWKPWNKKNDQIYEPNDAGGNQSKSYGKGDGKVALMRERSKKMLQLLRRRSHEPRLPKFKS